MYMDNGGAAAVLGTMKAAAKLGLKVNLRGVLALAENSIGPNAYRPGAIITSSQGPSVEIRNTDAEGRLALADALNWVQRKNSPRVLVDLATLTGACVMALGEYAAGLFSNSTDLTQQLQRASETSGERVWPVRGAHLQQCC
jgi:leucyl aminopeptidase